MIHSEDPVALVTLFPMRRRLLPKDVRAGDAERAGRRAAHFLPIHISQRDASKDHQQGVAKRNREIALVTIVKPGSRGLIWCLWSCS